MNQNTIENHPLPFFLPINAKILMLGSFPPPKVRWSMNFFYPNMQNDMWRIFGLLFFNNKNYFINISEKKFDEQKIRQFASDKGIAFGDTALSVVRQKANASDNFLDIVTPIKLDTILPQISMCHTLATTGQKATETLSALLGITPPKLGESTEFLYQKTPMHLFRMPSSSRAYPLQLERKAEFYKLLFQSIGLL